MTQSFVRKLCQSLLLGNSGSCSIHLVCFLWWFLREWKSFYIFSHSLLRFALTSGSLTWARDELQNPCSPFCLFSYPFLICRVGNMVVTATVYLCPLWTLLLGLLFLLPVILILIYLLPRTLALIKDTESLRKLFFSFPVPKLRLPSLMVFVLTNHSYVLD